MDLKENKLNMISVLLGLEQIYDDPVIRHLRLYLQDPLKNQDVERTLFLFKLLDGNDSILKNLQNYILNPLSVSEAEKILSILKILDSNPSKELLHQVKFSIINPDDILSIFKICFLSGIDDPFIVNLSKAITNYPTANWNDALSKGQLFSKLWLIDEVKKLDLDLGIAFVCAGWLGTLSALMIRDGNVKYKAFRSFDIDPTCAPAADTFNRSYVIDGWKFKASTADIFDISYPYQYSTQRFNGTFVELEEMPDTIINTSCDHIYPFDKWWSLIPEGKLVILQNNNSKIDDDHVNIINSIEEMKQQAPMTKVLYEGILPFPDYTRFMLIGIK